jgi:predicted DNA-binding transcriptional regulator AlpA
VEEIKLLKQRDLETLLGLKPSTLEQMRLTGRGPRFCKIGRSVRYRVEDLATWINENTFKSTTEADSVRGI